MAEAQFAFSWNSFQQNICSGLGSLQQNEDFVDMTVAADGHFVRVHQLVLSLASPYLKDLIKSGHSQNTVIFLNKISYTTLCSLLEYIYTGQVVVAKEEIEELIEAAQALHIKGLEDMTLEVTSSECQIAENISSPHQQSAEHDIQVPDYSNDTPFTEAIEDFGDENIEDLDHKQGTQVHVTNNDRDIPEVAYIQNSNDKKINAKSDKTAQVQYSVSNQGSLQMILNRFVYYLKYSAKTGHKKWRCTDYVKKKCPATVITKENVVLRRTSAHIHPFHDRKIAKRVRDNSIFSLITEAQHKGCIMKTDEYDNV